MPDVKAFYRETTALDKSNFSLRHGFRAAILVIAPLVVGFAINQPQAIYATLGAMLVTNTEGPNSSPLPSRVLLLACFTEPVAFCLGTLAGLTGLLAIPLIGLGVCIGLMASSDQEFLLAGRFTAITFAIGVGLPGGSVEVAWTRLWLAFVGALVAFAGSVVHHRLARRSAQPGRSKAFPKLPGLSDFTLKTAWVRDSIAVGIAAAVGYAIGLALGLPRDFWIVVTIISAVRTKFGPTFASASMMVVGTIIGATVAAGITLEVHNDYALEALFLLFGTLMFATRGVNLGLSQVFVTPFIIILLNILYPGEWYLAETRILDVAIGGALAMLTVYMIWMGTRLKDFDKIGALHRGAGDGER